MKLPPWVYGPASGTPSSTHPRPGVYGPGPGAGIVALDWAEAVLAFDPVGRCMRVVHGRQVRVIGPRGPTSIRHVKFAPRDLGALAEVLVPGRFEGDEWADARGYSLEVFYGPEI